MILTILLTIIAGGIVVAASLLALILWRLFRPLPPDTAQWLLRFTRLESNTTQVVIGIAEDVAGLNDRIDTLTAAVNALGAMPPEQIAALRQVTTEPAFRRFVMRSFVFIGVALLVTLILVGILAAELYQAAPLLGMG